MAIAEIILFWGSAAKLAQMYKDYSAKGATKTCEIDRAKAASETVDAKATNKAGEVKMKISSEPTPGTPIRGGSTIPKPPPSAGSFRSESFLATRLPWGSGLKAISCVGVSGLFIVSGLLVIYDFSTLLDRYKKYGPAVVPNNDLLVKLETLERGLKKKRCSNIGVNSDIEGKGWEDPEFVG